MTLIAGVFGVPPPGVTAVDGRLLLGGLEDGGPGWSTEDASGEVTEQSIEQEVDEEAKPLLDQGGTDDENVVENMKRR